MSRRAQKQARIMCTRDECFQMCALMLEENRQPVHGIQPRDHV